MDSACVWVTRFSRRYWHTPASRQQVLVLVAAGYHLAHHIASKTTARQKTHLLGALLRGGGRRAKAALPDLAGAGQFTAPQTVYRVGDLELDRLSHTVRRGGKEILLQPREFRLLEYLMKNAGQVVTRTMLLENVWDYHFDPQTNESYTPYVIETSIGVDRMFLSIMCHSYEEEKLENGETRTVIHLPAALAPVKLCILSF